MQRTWNFPNYPNFYIKSSKNNYIDEPNNNKTTYDYYYYYVADGEYFTVHVAFHPGVLDKLGKDCASKNEQDSLIQLALAYIEDQNKVHLSKHYYIQDFDFKGDTSSIRDDFGLAKDPMKAEFEKLAKSFAPVADIATKDPELIDQMTSGDGIKVTGEETKTSITIPGIPSGNGKPNKGLIEEVKTTPKYTLSHRGVADEAVARSLVVKIELDKVEGVHQCTLDITEVRLN